MADQQQQQQQQLLAALAAQSQLAAAYGPMAGVYNPYAMYGSLGNMGFFGGGLPSTGWPSTNDYMMWSAALQQQQQQQQQAMMSVPTTESFEDVLRKMAGGPVTAGDETGACTSAATVTPVTVQSPPVSTQSSSITATLSTATVSDIPDKQDGHGWKEEGKKRVRERSEETDRRKKKSKMVKKEFCNGEVEPGEVRRTADGRKLVADTAQNGNVQVESPSASATGTGQSTLSSDVQINSDLLEASARAWALLSNQLLMGMQQAAAVTTTNTDVKKKTVKVKKVEAAGGDALEDTINSVINSRPSVSVPAVKKTRNVSGPAQAKSRGGQGKGRDHGRRRVGGTGRAVSPDAPLDLSQKTSSITPHTDFDDEGLDGLVIDESATPSLDGDCRTGTQSSSSAEHDVINKLKRHVPDVALLRLPLSMGWRRQTCIRSLTGAGVRGDVIYYAPCGKRLGSYAEVIRYLNKSGVKEFGRDHFSFSCKVIVGDFLQIRTDGEHQKNGIVQLSEEEVAAKVTSLSGHESNGRCAKKATSNGLDAKRPPALKPPQAHALPPAAHCHKEVKGEPTGTRRKRGR